MLKDINLVFIILPFIAGAAIFVNVRKSKTGNMVQDKLNDLLTKTIIVGAFLVMLWFMLPFTSSLSTFGYPEDIADIDTQKKMLSLLQEYNKAITRTTDVLYWMIFIIAFWLLTSLYSAVKAIKDQVDKQNFKDNDESDT